jgi:hypothetical protein
MHAGCRRYKQAENAHALRYRHHHLEDLKQIVVDQDIFIRTHIYLVELVCIFKWQRRSILFRFIFAEY